MYQERIDFLKQSHQALNQQIDLMSQQPGVDHTELLTLKKKRLNIKDEIALLENKQEFFEENGVVDD